MTATSPASPSGNPPPPRSVFISYASADRKVAVQVVALLEAAGFDVWWDGLLEGGQRFSNVIADALDGARAVVVLWSATSTASHWVQDEAERGRDTGRLVPLSIDGSLPPLGFGQFQAINVSGALDRPGSEAVGKLLRAVGALVEREPLPQARARPPAVSRRGALVLGGAAMAAIGGGALLLNRGAIWPGTAKPRIAVLPFANLTGDPGQRYFSDGLTSEIRTRLTRNPLLEIVGQASSEAVDGQSGDLRKIAADLGVAFVLAGNVQRAGERIKIAAEMTDGRSGISKWAQSYERPIADIFAVQNEIAGTVAQALSVALGPREGEAAGTVGGTRNVAAFDAYLHGRDLYEQSTDEAGDRAALAFFDRAIALDPAYAGAHAMRARALIQIANAYDGDGQREQDYALAVAAAQKATQLAPRFAEGFSALGNAFSTGTLNMRAATGPFRRSYELAPGDADILARYGTFLSRLRRTGEAAAVIAQSARLDPLNARTFRSGGEVRLVAGDYRGAIEQFRVAVSLNPSLASYDALIGTAQLLLGDLDAATASFEREKKPVRRLPGLAIIAHRRGNRPAAQGLLAALMAEMGDKSLYQYAQIHAQWGDKARALDLLEQAWQRRDGGFVLMYSDPLLAPLRAEPRFRALAAGAGFE